MSVQVRPKKDFLRDRDQGKDNVDPEFETLLDYIKHNRGCDLTGYKRASLMRRFQYRMQNINIDTYQNYLNYLQCHADEYLELLNDVLINVTSFFRDRAAWNYLAATVIPKIIASKQPDESIRVWSAGCATGEEILSLLILLAEAIGLEACLERVQCFATDADEVALRQARQAIYNTQVVANIPPEWLQKYFEQTEKGYIFHPALRRTIIFARHDLLKNAPISRIDLLACRNVLIYFNPEAQTTILARLHFALSNTGFLVLGQAETLVNRRQVFTAVNLKHRIYTKGGRLELHDILAIAPKSLRQSKTDLLPPQTYFWEATFESSPSAHIAIDRAGCLLQANEQARLLFGLTFEDWKRPFQELALAKLISASTLAKALHSQQSLATLKNVEWATAKGIKHFDIDILRVITSTNHVLGVTLTFSETSDHQQLIAELESTRSELTRVSDALAATKAELNTARRELESTQKELEILSQETHFDR